MKIELSIEKRIFFLLIIFLFFPGLIIITVIFKNTGNILHEKYNIEITQKRNFINNYFSRQKKDLKKILNQLSSNREISSIFKELIVYGDEQNSKDKLKNIAENLDFSWCQIYSNKKKFILSSKNKIYIPKSLFKENPNVSFLKIDNKIYLIGLTPLFIGENEKNIYGYIALIRKFDKNYLKKLSVFFNSSIDIIVSLTKNVKIQKTENFTPILTYIGETVIGEYVILICWYNTSFFNKFENKEKSYYIYLIIGLFFFCVFIAYILSKSFLTPLKRLDKMIKELSSGKFTFKKLTYTIKDEIHDIIENLNNLFLKLKKSFKEIYTLTKEQTNHYTNLNEKIYLLNKNKKSIIENSEQLNNICNEINEKISDVSKNISIISDKYKSNEKLFQEIKELTENGFHISKISNVTFKEINRNSEAIKNILNFITDISSQINLLSVNASIEAIKSGEAGAGFSVVADEIKRLAQTTNEFVENIKKLIENNYHIVKQGAEYSQQLDNILNELNVKVIQASDLFLNINSIIKEQKRVLTNIGEKLDYPQNINTVLSSEFQNIENLLETFESEFNQLLSINKQIIDILSKYIGEDKNEKI